MKRDRRSTVQAARRASVIEALEPRAYLAVTLGDLVWKDDNANGIQDRGEIGFGGIGLRLVTAGGTVLATTTTSADGHYQFTNVAAGQSVYIEITNVLIPGGTYTLSPKDAGADSQRNSKFNRDTSRTDVFTVVDGQNRLDLDAGAVPAASISGSVYEDLNGNGSLDPSEPTTSGFTTFLDTNGNNVLDAGEPSHVDFVNFSGLLPGEYRLCVVPRAGWTTPPAQAIDVPIGQTITANVPVVPDEVTSPLIKNGSSFRVNTQTTYFTSAPDVAMNASGRSVVVWQTFFNTGTTQTTDVHAQIYDDSGAAIGSEFTVPVASGQTSPLVSMAADGTFVVAVAASGNLVMRRFSTTGSPLAAASTIASGTATAVASDASGNFVLVWTSANDGDSSGVFAQRFTADATPLGAAFRVNTTVAGAQANGDVSMNATGAFVVTWTSSGQDGDGNGIYAQRYDASGNAIGGEFRVNTVTAGNQTNARVSINADGAFVVAWRTDTPSYTSRLQYFDADGTPRNGEQLVGTFPGIAAVALDDSGAYSIVWDDRNNNTGLNARRFSASGAPMGTSNLTYAGALTSIHLAASGNGDMLAVWDVPGSVAGATSIQAARFTAPPGVLVAAPNLTYSSPSSFSIRFSEDVQSSLQKSDLLVENLTAGTSVDPADMDLAYDASDDLATFSFPELAGGMLPSGSWRFTLAGSGVTNSAGRPLASDLVYRMLWVRLADAGGSLRLRRSSTSSGANDEIYDLAISNVTPAYTAPLSTLNALIVRGGDADDSLQFDSANGFPSSIAAPSYDLGGQQEADIVTVNGATTSDNEFTYDGQTIVNVFSRSSVPVISTAESFVIQGADGYDTLVGSDFAGDKVRFVGEELDIIGGGSDVFTHDLQNDFPGMNVFVEQGRVTASVPQHLGALSITTAMTLNRGGGVLAASSLGMGAQAWLDLGDNDLIVNYSGNSPIGAFNGSAYTGIAGMIQRGRNGGAWDGLGLVTSAAGGDLQTLGIAEASQVLGASGGMFHGESVDGTSVLVKYTFTGDANLDGVINGDDYFAIDAGFTAHATGYANGDFNYDGRINADDYFLIDSNYNKAQTPLGAPVLAAAPLKLAGVELPEHSFAATGAGEEDGSVIDLIFAPDRHLDLI